MLNRSGLTSTLVLCSFAAWAGDDTTNAPDTASSDATETELTAENVDLEAAEKIFKKSCRACHGNKAQGVASYPNLSKRDAEYIAEKLETYRAGEKIGPNSMLMIPHAKKLSDDEIAALAVYVTTAFAED